MLIPANLLALPIVVPLTDLLSSRVEMFVRSERHSKGLVA
jgi:hypothetical protein